jgi:hypothetical protein
VGSNAGISQFSGVLGEEAGFVEEGVESEPFFVAAGAPFREGVIGRPSNCSAITFMTSGFEFSQSTRRFPGSPSARRQLSRSRISSGRRAILPLRVFILPLWLGLNVAFARACHADTDGHVEHKIQEFFAAENRAHLSAVGRTFQWFSVLVLRG